VNARLSPGAGLPGKAPRAKPPNQAAAGPQMTVRAVPVRRAVFGEANEEAR
jgi:hypothetical protein